MATFRYSYRLKNNPCVSLKVNSFAKLVDSLKKLPLNISTISFDKGNLGVLSSAELKEVFSALPANIAEVILSGNAFDKKSGAELKEAFSGLPVNITAVNLSCNNLDKKSGAELKEAFSGLPASITAVNLMLNELDNKSGLTLKEAFSGLPVNMRAVHLGFNKLNLKSGAELKVAFSGLPANVTAVGLDFNFFGLKSGAELKEVFLGLPANITRVDLRGNVLGNKSGSELKEAFSGLSVNMRAVHLGFNQLGSKSGAELKVAFSGLPANITTVDLSGNDLGNKSGSELKEAFSGLPGGIISISLKDNSLSLKSGAELKTAFSGLPDTISEIDLSGNFFEVKKPEELELAFSGLSDKVTVLKFCNSSLDHLSTDELVAFLQTIPKHVTLIHLQGNDLFRNKTPTERDSLLKALGDLREHGRLNLSDNGESDLARALPIMPKLTLLPNELKEHVLSFVSTASPSKIKHHLAQAETMECQRQSLKEGHKQLITLLGALCNDEAFWARKVRFPNKTDRVFPQGIDRIRKIILEHHQNPNNSACLKKIIACASRHSAHFQWAHQALRGRDEVTNHIYGVLKKINAQDKKSIDDAVNELRLITGVDPVQNKNSIDCLLDSYLNQRTAVTTSSKVTKEYFHGSFFSLFQKSFTQKRKAVEALQSALNGDRVDLSEHLSTLRNGHLGNQLRAFIKSGSGNALVGKEVATVSEFVQALEEKNANQAQLS